MRKLLALSLLLVNVPLLTGAVTAGEGVQDNAGSKLQQQPVKSGSVAQTVKAMGTLEPEEVADVGSQVAGLVLEFGRDPSNPQKVIDYNSVVDKGTVLARLDSSVYKVRADQARAGLGAAEAKVKLEDAKFRLAEREREKVRKRLADRTASQDDLEESASRCEVARAQVAVAQGNVEVARAVLDEAKLNLANTVIRSPIKGIVVDRRVNVGQMVATGTNAPSLFLIASDTKRLQVWASVPEAEISSIRIGQRAHFTVEAYPGQVFVGTVSQVRMNAALTQKVVTYAVIINVDNPDGTLLPYLTANVSFQVAEPKKAALSDSPNVRREKTIPFEFREEPWDAVLEWLGRQSGLPIRTNYRPTGTFTFIAPKQIPERRYTISQVIAILNEGLVNQKHMLVLGSHSINIVPEDVKTDPVTKGSNKSAKK